MARRVSLGHATHDRKRCARIAWFTRNVGLAGCHLCQSRPNSRRRKADANARVLANAENKVGRVKIPPFPIRPMIPVGFATRTVAGLAPDRLPLTSMTSAQPELDRPVFVGGEPVAAFREKLEAAAPTSGQAIVSGSMPGRVTAPNHGRRASRFREEAGKPVVCCLMVMRPPGLLSGGLRTSDCSATSLTENRGSHQPLTTSRTRWLSHLTSESVKTGSKVDMAVTSPWMTRRELSRNRRSYRDDSVIGLERSPG